MRVEEALASRLRATAELTALVGTRIYPAKAPQNTRAAYLVYDLLGGEVVAAHGGAGGLRQGRISFSCCAGSYGAAKAVAEALRRALAGVRFVEGGVEVALPMAHEDEDLWDDGLELYVVVVDFELYWRG